MNWIAAFRISSILALTAVPAVASATEWKIDKDHSKIGFSVRHLMVSNVEGRFLSFDGTVKIDEKDVTKSKVLVTIDMNSVNTENEKRDKHLRSGDFFNAEKHPKMVFESKKVEKHGKKLKLHGNLTIRGVTKPVVLEVVELTDPVKHPFAKMKVRGAVAHTTINRTDFGLTWNKTLETGGLLVGEEVEIQLQLELATPS